MGRCHRRKERAVSTRKSSLASSSAGQRLARKMISVHAVQVLVVFKFAADTPLNVQPTITRPPFRFDESTCNAYILLSKDADVAILVDEDDGRGSKPRVASLKSPRCPGFFVHPISSLIFFFFIYCFSQKYNVGRHSGSAEVFAKLQSICYMLQRNTVQKFDIDSDQRMNDNPTKKK